MKGEENNLSTYINEFGTALGEASSLNYVREAFLKLDKHHLRKERIKQCLGGSFHSDDEDPGASTHHARNILFELETNAYFLMKGYDVTNEFEDVNINIDDYKVSIQCKRPSNFGQLKACIDEAYAQLVKNNNMLEYSNSFGFIAISLEKLYKLDAGQLIMQMKDEKDFEIKLETVNCDFTEIVRPYWNNIVHTYNNINLIGMIYYYKVPVRFTTRNQLSYKHEFLINFPGYPLITNPPVSKIIDYIKAK